MNYVTNALREHPELAVFLTLALGFLIGRVKIGSFSLGTVVGTLLAGVAITLGVTVATAMIAVATNIGDKINRELRSYGANLIVTPQEDTLDLELGGRPQVDAGGAGHHH